MDKVGKRYDSLGDLLKTVGSEKKEDIQAAILKNAISGGQSHFFSMMLFALDPSMKLNLIVFTRSMQGWGTCILERRYIAEETLLEVDALIESKKYPVLFTFRQNQADKDDHGHADEQRGYYVSWVEKRI